MPNMNLFRYYNNSKYILTKLFGVVYLIYLNQIYILSSLNLMFKLFNTKRDDK